MTAIAVKSRPEEIPPALLNPEPTGEKRIRRYNAALAAKRAKRSKGKREKQTERVIPGLDVAALQAKYGGDPANTTQVRIGTFKVPVGIPWDRWERIRNVATERFLKALESQGWVVEKVVARNGVYPYRDLLTGQDDPYHREMQLVATCGYPKAERVVVELDPEDVEPIVQKR